MRRRQGGKGWAIAAIVMGGLLALPALSIAAQIFVPHGPAWDQLWGTVLPAYIANTLVLAVVVGLGTGILGTGLAWLTVRTRFAGHSALSVALMLPFAAPAYVIAYAYGDLLQTAGPVQTALRAVTGLSVGSYWFPDIRTVWGAAFIFTLALYPYVYLLARAAFLQQPASLFDAARLLGAGPWRRFARVALPLARPAIAGGIALALMEMLADFGAVSYLSVQTFTTGIYRAWYAMGDRPAAGQLAAMLLGVVILFKALEHISRKGRPVHGASGTVPQPVRLRGWKGVAAIIVCSLAPLFGFVVPAIALVRLWIMDGGAAVDARFMTAAATSLGLAALAAALIVLIAIVLAYARRAAPGRATSWAKHIAVYGYALPGSVIAIGILVPLTAFDKAINAFMLEHFGIRTGLLITGSIAGLLFAYAVRFAAPALEAVESGFQRITPSIASADC
jgi:iron(III) transport system permease protein